MAQSTTIILLPQTSYTAGPPASTIVTGNAYPAASYYLSSQDLQTVVYSVTGFIGTINIQATLMDTPQNDSDWFTVYNIPFTNSSGTTLTSFENIIGNFVWIRIRITNFTMGAVNSIKVSY
jgi:hypothetical protein